MRGFASVFLGSSLIMRVSVADSISFLGNIDWDMDFFTFGASVTGFEVGGM